VDCVNLKPKEHWRPVFYPEQRRTHRRHESGTRKDSGCGLGFSQPIEDNVKEAVSGVKAQLSAKLYGDDLKVLEEKPSRSPAQKAVPTALSSSCQGCGLTYLSRADCA
jgi:Cu/Ag efflux pump CusA